LIDDTEGIHIEAVYGGGYDLGTADGRMQARVVGAFARGEAEKKSERQRLGAQRDAAAGKARKGCPRPFGWLDDRVTMHPQEGTSSSPSPRTASATPGPSSSWEAPAPSPASVGTV
jgi:site-specific DNA recombinase